MSTSRFWTVLFCPFKYAFRQAASPVFRASLTQGTELLTRRSGYPEGPLPGAVSRWQGFIAARICTVMPRMRNFRKQVLDLFHEGGKAVLSQSLNQLLSCTCHLPATFRQVLGQSRIEAALHLEVLFS